MSILNVTKPEFTPLYWGSVVISAREYKMNEGDPAKLQDLAAEKCYHLYLALLDRIDRDKETDESA